MEILSSLRRKAGNVKRITRDAANSLARLPETISRLEEIDRRIARIDLAHQKAAAPEPKQDFSPAGIELLGKNLLSLKQNWPLSTSVFSSRLVCDSRTPIPPLSSRARVQGSKCVEEHPEDHHFLNSGFSDLRAVFNIAGVYGVDLDQNFSVLDFGVGCARMARHLPPGAREGLMGVDVDPVNIAWCTQNMAFGRYEAIQPASAIPAPNRSFDLIYSHSVFTHLTRDEQDHWLKELGRVSRGLMILSVHGLYSSFRIAAWSRDPACLTNWLKEGFVDAGVPNPDISDVVDTEYYRDVAHTSDYIRRHWSNFLDVVEIIPGGFGNVHDAIVLRSKRA